MKSVLSICALLIGFLVAIAQAQAMTSKEELGQFLYFDKKLSNPFGQSCASCHEPEFAFVDPDKNLPVSEGVISGRFGGRNSPSAAYAMYSPSLHEDTVEGLWIGGQFWDGRATGDELGDPLADQALGPFVNPDEMNNTKEGVINAVKNSAYATLFELVWGPGSLGDVEAAYGQVALSIAAFERTRQFGGFTSKYDAYLASCLELGGDPDQCAQGSDTHAEEAGKLFSRKEWRGLQLFMGENDNDGVFEKDEGAMCSACHVAEWTDDPGNVFIPDWSPDGRVPPLFSDFTYDNLGIPKSKHRLLKNNPVDFGIGTVLHVTDENGKFKVMSLRNIEQTKPYGHNGFFKSLDKITEFYNTRDVQAERWAEPEYPDTVNKDELGNLGLSGGDVKALVSFMKTLTDGYGDDQVKHTSRKK